MPSKKRAKNHIHLDDRPSDASASAQPPRSLADRLRLRRLRLNQPQPVSRTATSSLSDSLSDSAGGGGGQLRNTNSLSSGLFRNSSTHSYASARSTRSTRSNMTTLTALSSVTGGSSSSAGSRRGKMPSFIFMHYLLVNQSWRGNQNEFATEGEKMKNWVGTGIKVNKKFLNWGFLYNSKSVEKLFELIFF